MAIIFTILLLHILHATAANFTFVNKCSHTIWPAVLGSPALETTGFELPAGGSRAFSALTGWSGRFWARTGCSFDGAGHGSCATGDYASGRMECGCAGATAATLAEFTLGFSMDFYDVSLVDGYNLPKSSSYAYDDATSTFTCAGGDYVIPFWPSQPRWRSDDGSGSVQETVLTKGHGWRLATQAEDIYVHLILLYMED